MSNFGRSVAFCNIALDKGVFAGFLLLLSIIVLLLSFNTTVFPQQYGHPYINPYPANGQQPINQTATKQEIARLEIKVSRGSQTLPLAQVPRVQKGDVLKVRLLEEPVSGVKIDQTAWDWTLVVAYANPLINKEKQETASMEVQFRKQGWYKEYSFVVPYDSQPVFFLSPRGNFRNQVMKAMNKNFTELQKIGEKMVEISGAYAQISTFLNELQSVINVNQNTYGNNPYGGQNQYGYNPYGTYNPYGGQNGYNGQYNYGNQYGNYNQNQHWLDQAVERLAKSFNIQMPDCFRANNSSNGYNNYNGGYNTGGNNGGNGGGYVGGGGTYTGGYTTGNNGNFNTQDFVARSQCVAKTVRLEDFDVSITRMWQQGGVFIASELQKKYPQLAYYINIAAAAIDFIVKVFQKSPLRIVPTLITSPDAQASNTYQVPYNTAGQQQQQSAYGAQNAYAFKQNVQTQPNNPGGLVNAASGKISIFSSAQPSDQGFLTAYPIVVQKWQANADAEVISLYPPALMEACLHTGVNILKNTNLSDEMSADTYTRDFKLIVTSTNGFRKEFPLRKNLGLGGWELNLSQQDTALFPKTLMSLEGQIAGLRGFNEVISPKFNLPLAISDSSKWEVVTESQQSFTVGGRRRVAVRNLGGDCRCLQSITYKPSFGGQFTFEAGARENGLQFSPDGKIAWFEVDSTNFQPGQGALEIKNYGGDTANVNIKLYPHPPKITNVNVARGDRELTITGERLDQLKFVVIDGFRAAVQANVFPPDTLNPQITTKLVAFDNPKARLTTNSVVLELGLEDDRRFSFPQAFTVSPSRPTIASDEGEITGLSDATLNIREKVGAVKGELTNTASLGAQLIARHSAVFPIETNVVSLNIQNILTDYEFKNENLKIETRIEKSQIPAGDYLNADFEVLDWKTMRLKFLLHGDIHTQLGGRRIQFRIKDSERGNSDWYTVKQTFIRVPKVTQVKCTPEMSGLCEMKGEGMDYVAQVSVDGGKSWYPGGDSETLSAQPTADGLSAVMIPHLINKKFLQLRLRDFPRVDGLEVSGFNYLSTVKTSVSLKPVTVKKNNPVDQTPEPQKNQGLPISPATPYPAAEMRQLPKQSKENTFPVQQVPRVTPPPPDALPPGNGSLQVVDEVIDMGKPKP